MAAEPKDRTVVTVAHPGVIGRARLPMSALKHMPGWRVVGDGQAPVTGKQSRRARQKAKPKPTPPSPVVGTEEQE